MTIENLWNETLTLSKVLKEGVVYLVNRRAREGKTAPPPLVIKMETLGRPTDELPSYGSELKHLIDARASLAYMIRLYGAVCTGMPEMRMLNAGELPVVFNLVGQAHRAAVLATTSKGRRVVPDAKDTRCFYAMECLANLDDFGQVANKFVNSVAVPRSPEAQSTLNRLFALTSRNPLMFKELGRIIIADLFVGNTDRVDAVGTEVRAVANWGNVFITSNAERTSGRFCGIDFYYGGSPMRFFFGNLEEQEMETHWPVELLNEAGNRRRDDLATRVIGGFVAAATQVGSAFTPTSHRKALRAGMSEGRTALKNFYTAQKKARIPIPSSILSRFEKLWH